MLSLSTTLVVLMTSIKAPHVENEARDSRAPIDLVAVIDRSGSMQYVQEWWDGGDGV